MNYSKNIDSYGSEFWSFNAAGVSYPNKDGTLRQDIIGALNCGSHYNCRIDEYLYQEEKAYYIVIDGKIVGNVPRNIAKEFAAKSAAGYIMEITAAGIHGGPSADFDDDDDDGEPRYYGVHLTVKLISPTEQKIKSITETDGVYAVGEPERHSSVRDEPIDEHIESLESNSPIEQKIKSSTETDRVYAVGEPERHDSVHGERTDKYIESPESNRPPKKNKKRLSFLGTVAILLLAFMVLTGISNALAKALHTTKHPTGERLNINNVEKYAPDLNDKQEDQTAPAAAEASDGEEYYTEEEQAAAAAAYYASIGGNPYLQDDAEADMAEEPTEESYTYILNTNTKVFHRQNCSSAKRIKDSSRSSATGTRDEIIEKGYSPCGICKP